MIGIGIFLMPRIVAESVASDLGFLAMWLLGGLVALSGAVACGELGAMMPRAGGDYVFQRRAFGSSVAFASGCVLFGAVFTGSIAATSVAVCRYQLAALLHVDLMQPAFAVGGIDVPIAHLTAVVIVLVLSALNALGARIGALAQTLLVYPPIALFLAIALAALLRGGAGATPVARAGGVSLTTAFVAIYFAYSGWINVIYVAGEVRRPERNIPFGLIAGTVAVTALYLLLCGGFLSVLGLDGLAGLGFTDAGTATAERLGGPALSAAVTLAIAAALLATTNATIFGGARVAYAMAGDGALPRTFARLAGPAAVPVRALWFQALLAIAFILSGTFDQIVEAVGLAMLITGSLTVLALFALRVREPDAPRPYLATAYPWLPGFYLLACGVVLAHRTWETGAGLASGTSASALPLVGLVTMLLAFVSHRFGAQRRRS